MSSVCDHRGSLSSNSRCSRCGASVPSGGEASGLIDVRALAALMNPAPRRDPQAPRMSDLTVAPVTLAPAPSAAVRSSVAPAQMPLYYMLGALALGMMALATFIVSRPPASGPVTEVIVARAPERAPAAEAPVERAAAVEVAPEVEAPAEAAPEAAPEPAKSARKGSRKQPASAPAAPAPKPIAPASKPAAVTDEPAPDSVSCLIEPAKCKPKSQPAPKVEDPPPVPGASLPEKLEPADISEGTRAAKAAAQERCRTHARGGEKVTIKLSISGPEGVVASASPQDDAGNPQLAACCVAELSRSTFKKVQKQQIGAVATLKF